MAPTCLPPMETPGRRQELNRFGPRSGVRIGGLLPLGLLCVDGESEAVSPEFPRTGAGQGGAETGIIL